MKSTDLQPFAGLEAVKAHQDCLDLMSLDKLISWINANCESVSRRQLATVKGWESHGAAGAIGAKKFN